jgi:hypothetical protein
LADAALPHAASALAPPAVSDAVRRKARREVVAPSALEVSGDERSIDMVVAPGR